MEIVICIFASLAVLAVEHVASAIRDLASAIREQKRASLMDLKSCEPLRDWHHEVVDNGDGTQTIHAEWKM